MTLPPGQDRTSTDSGSKRRGSTSRSGNTGRGSLDVDAEFELLVKVPLDGEGLEVDGDAGGCDEEGSEEEEVGGAALSNIGNALRIFFGGEFGGDPSLLTCELLEGPEDEVEEEGRGSSSSIFLFFLQGAVPPPPTASSSSLPNLAAISSSVSSLTPASSPSSSEMRSITSCSFDLAFPFDLVSFDGAGGGGGGLKNEVRLDWFEVDFLGDVEDVDRLDLELEDLSLGIEREGGRS